jgi:hypothetical protein
MADEDLELAAGTDERIYCWVYTEVDPVTLTSNPEWALTATNTSPSGFVAGAWDDDGWSDAKGRIRAWSPRISTDLSVSSAGTYQAWVRWTSSNDQLVLKKPPYYVKLV